MSGKVLEKVIYNFLLKKLFPYISKNNHWLDTFIASFKVILKI
jgi:hypothetical protein